MKIGFLERLNKGFSLLELLITILILGIILTIVMTSLSGTNSNQALLKSTTEVLSVLDEARSMTLSAIDNSQYGVHIEADRVVRFKGSSYSAVSIDNRETLLNPLVGIRNITLTGGGVNVIFNRLTGTTAQPGTLEVYLKASTTNYKKISVQSTGVIEEI